MQTFKEFLLGEDTRKARTQVVSVTDFINWADNNASVYLNGPHFLYRGGSGDRQKGLRIGNAAGAGITPRESANTHNNYTLWIDNHPSFKGWPRRSLSFIATDDRDVAEGFGGAALLVVHDEAQIGIVGHDDLWNTPLDIPGEREITIEEFNGWTQHYFYEKKKQVITYQQLSTALKSITLDDLEDDGFDEQIKGYMASKELNNLYDVWNALIIPKIFANKTTGARVGDASTDGEVWIQGEVGFIPHIKRLSKSDAERLAEWADQYPELNEELQNHWSADFEDYYGDD